MRRYNNEKETELIEVKCNSCGKNLLVEQGILKEGHAEIEIKWGYFSHKDGMCHRFDLCESCYDKMVRDFKLPIDKEEEREYL